MVVLKYTQVNKDTLDNLVFTKDDRDNIVVNYRDANNTFKNEKLTIQGTTMRVPFGVSRNDNGRIGPFVMSFEARKVNNEEKMNEFNTNMKKFREVMTMIANKCKDVFIENSSDWMNDDDLDEDELDEMYKSFIQESEGYPDKLKVELNDFSYSDKKTGETRNVQTEFYHYKNHEQMSSDLMLTTGSLKGDFLKPKLRLDSMIVKRGDSGKGESIRPKLTMMKTKYFPGERTVKDLSSRFNHVSEDED